jgi:hypothetical protein
MSRKVIEKGWNIGSLLPLYRGVDFTFRGKGPEEYGIEFLDDVMYERYRNKLWRDEELIFIKGNRINIQKGIEEGFSDYGGWFYGGLFLLLLFFLFIFSVNSIKMCKMMFKVVFRKLCSFVRGACSL